MERINGFVNLDELLPESLNELIRKGIINDDTCFKAAYKIKLKDSNYYFKECSYQEAITELVVSEILNNIKLECVKYDLAYLKGAYGVISKDFKRQGKKYTEGEDILSEYIKNLPGEIVEQEENEFKQFLREEYMKFKGSAIEAGYTKNNFELIWHAIESHFKDYDNKDEIVAKIMAQLSTMHLVDILLSNEDRNRSNWCIEEDGKEANLVPMFDNGEAFKSENWMALVVEPLNIDSIDSNGYIELKQFLNRSDSSYYKLFLQLKDKISVESLTSAMTAVENKIGVNIDEKTKNAILESYKVHLEKLDEVLNTYKTIEDEGR